MQTEVQAGTDHWWYYGYQRGLAEGISEGKRRAITIRQDPEQFHASAELAGRDSEERVSGGLIDAHPSTSTELVAHHMRNVKGMVFIQVAMAEVIYVLNLLIESASKRNINTSTIWPGVSGDDLTRMTNKLNEILQELQANKVEITQIVQRVGSLGASTMIEDNVLRVYLGNQLVWQKE